MIGWRWYVLIFALSALIGVSASVLVATALPSRAQPPAVEWLETDYVPVSGCPGDTFSYSIRLRVTRPAVLFLAVSNLRGFDGDTVEFGRSGNMAVTTIPSARIIEDNDPVFVIPDLPPGDYVRVLAAGTLSEDSVPAIRPMPFTVRDDCGD